MVPKEGFRERKREFHKRCERKGEGELFVKACVHFVVGGDVAERIRYGGNERMGERRAKTACFGERGALKYRGICDQADETADGLME